MDLIGTRFSLALGAWRLRFELAIDEIEEEHALLEPLGRQRSAEPLPGKDLQTAIYK